METVTDRLRDLFQGISIHDGVIWLEVGNPLLRSSGKAAQDSPAAG